MAIDSARLASNGVTDWLEVLASVGSAVLAADRLATLLLAPLLGPGFGSIPAISSSIPIIARVLRASRGDGSTRFAAAVSTTT